MSDTNVSEPINRRKPLSVSAALNIAKSIISEHSFHIIGEVSELNQKPGYKAVYFTIKDESATLPCLMWMNRYKSTGVPLRLGARVEIVGKFTIFAPKGRMNFDVSSLKLAGEGDLRAQVAQLALKLRNEGLMDPSRKRSPVPFPQKIGLVTSPRGAAVHDVLRTLRRRYPLAQILFAGVSVEGKHAANDLIEGLNAVIDAGAEEVLLVRGGGSFEDLMPFNDEKLARALAHSPIPVITGIGHEPDTSIADMVADVRASTPTAAAEAVSPDRADLLEMLDDRSRRMNAVFLHRIDRSIALIDSYASRPIFRDPHYLIATDLQLVDHFQKRLEGFIAHFGENDHAMIESMMQRLSISLPYSLQTRYVDLAQLDNRLHAAAESLLDNAVHEKEMMQSVLIRIGKSLTDPYRARAALLAARLNDLSPLAALERGWSITTDRDGVLVRSIEQAKTNEALLIQVCDGAIDCMVIGTQRRNSERS